MKTHIQETDRFLKNHLMHPDCINLHEQTGLFIEEMEKGLAGKEASSLLMLPSFISLDGDLPVNKRVIVIDAGGTNLRVAVVSFDMQGAMTLGTYDSNGRKCNNLCLTFIVDRQQT